VEQKKAVENEDDFEDCSDSSDSDQDGDEASTKLDQELEEQYLLL
jgi:hypothetical protein